MADTGLPINPFTTSSPDSTNANVALGRGTEVLTAEIHGKYFSAAARGSLFSFNQTAVKIPLQTSTMTSLCSLYNPIGSNKLLELVFFDMGIVLPITVVDTTGLYIASPVLTAKGTFTTAGTAQPGLLNSGFVGVGVPYTSYTHNGAVTRWMSLAMFGAVNTATNQMAHYQFDGRAIIPPGSIVSVANATAASSSTDRDIDVSWLETTIV